jgi:putative CocE/NonD family hydrolase
MLKNRIATTAFLSAALCLSAMAADEVRTFVATLGGKEVGKATVTISDNDVFVSSSTLDLLGNKNESKLTFNRDLTKNSRISFEDTTSGNKSEGRLENGKIQVLTDGKFTDVPGIDATGLPYLTLHPALFHSWGDALFNAVTGDKIKFFSLDNAKQYTSVVKVSERSAVISNAPRKVRVLKLSLENIEIHVFYTVEDKTVYGLHVPMQRFAFLDQRASSVIEDPVDKFKELSPSAFQVTETDGISIPMRDGTTLKASLRLPSKPGRYPTILMRSPYPRIGQLLDADWWAKRGYAVLAQDVRGTGESGGVWDPFNREIQDGYDTLEWITKQPWSDAKVGMIGASYGGTVQWSAAVSGHPALKCIIPQVSPPDPMLNMPYENGLFFLAPSLWWTSYVYDGKPGITLPPTQSIFLNPDTLTRPVSKADDAVIGSDVKFWNDWLRRRTLNDWKGAFRLDQVGKVKIPILHISGVWDGDGVGTKLHWEEQRKAGGNQWVIFGPWTHAFNTTTQVLDQDYGSQSMLELNSVYLRFFDTFLKGKEVGQEKQPRVRMFITGANYWEKTSDFPLPGSKLHKRFLSGQGVLGRKRLGALASKPSGGSSRYKYDPNSKDSPLLASITNANSMSVSLANRSPILIYRTEAFVQPTTITGPMEASLYFSTTARDAGLHVMVFEQDSRGKLWLLGSPGTHRVTYRDGDYFSLKPHQVVKVNVRPWWIAHQLKPGSRLAIGVFSDARPTFAPIPGTGEFEGTATKYIKATHTIHTSAKYPSSFSFYLSE